MEKRSDDRSELNCPASISMDGERYQCTIKNFSRRGALLCLDRDSQDRFTLDLMGNVICFDDDGGLPDIFRNPGRVLRLLDDGEAVYLAVCFI